MIPSNNHKPGPELDRLVAEAMGWEFSRKFSWWSGPNGESRFAPQPYSTAFGLQTQEMLDWLDDEEMAAFRYLGEWHVDWRNQSQCVMLGEVRGDVKAEAPTLPHALSLLVLAVAEWRQKGVAT